MNIRFLSPNGVLIDELISVNNIDLLHLTETWLYKYEYVSLNESTSPSHINTHIPRDTGRGGGVAAIFNSALLINPKPKQKFSSFINLILSNSNPTMETLQPTIFVILYRAPGPYTLSLYHFQRFSHPWSLKQINLCMCPCRLWKQQLWYCISVTVGISWLLSFCHCSDILHWN